MSNTILHISHEDRSADILASEVRAIIRLPMECPMNEVHPERTRVEYGGGGGGITLPISREEHDALVAAWRASM